MRCGIGVAVQPAFLRWDQEPLSYLAGILGERACTLSPLRCMADMCIPLSGGSDAPCTPPDPIVGIWAACNHPDPGQSLTVQEALNLYTRGAARMGFDEKERGSLEQGKAADMVILSANPLAVGPARLREVRVDSLLLAGAPYRPGQGKASMLLRASSRPEESSCEDAPEALPHGASPHHTRGFALPHRGRCLARGLTVVQGAMAHR